MDCRERAAIEGRWYDRVDRQQMVALIRVDDWDDPPEFVVGEKVEIDGKRGEVTAVYFDGEEADVAFKKSTERISHLTAGLLRAGEVLGTEEDGSYEGQSIVAVPIRFEVCPTCDGKGSHVNPSIDAHGITASEWAEWDEDDRETYRTGGYDVPCYECGGANVVPVPVDEDKLPPVVKWAIEHRRDVQRWNREDARICRMESGGY